MSLDFRVWDYFLSALQNSLQRTCAFKGFRMRPHVLEGFIFLVKHLESLFYMIFHSLHNNKLGVFFSFFSISMIQFYRGTDQCIQLPLLKHYWTGTINYYFYLLHQHTLCAKSSSSILILAETASPCSGPAPGTDSVTCTYLRNLSWQRSFMILQVDIYVYMFICSKEGRY